MAPRALARLAALAAILVAGAARADGPAAPQVTPPALVQGAVPLYPEAERASGRTAVVVLDLLVDAEGKVAGVDVRESAGPAFDAAADAAARELVFEPARVDGRAVAAKVRFRFEIVPPAPAPAVEEVSVHAAHVARQTTAIAIAPEEARRVPGTEGDTLKVVQNLPGVARAPLGSGQLVVWGAAPSDTLVYVDGVPVPALYHGGGLRGVVNSDLVMSIDLVPGAYGAEYGRGLGGLVRVETKALAGGARGYVAADTLDGSAMVETKVGERVHVAIAGRYGWLDRVLAATAYPDVGDTFPVPRYRDAQAKATFALRDGETLDAVFLASGDDLARVVPSSDPAAVRSESTSSAFWRAYARYQRVLHDGTTVTATPFVGRDTSSLVQSFGDVPARLDQDAWRYGLRASEASALGPVTLTTGVDLSGTVAALSRAGTLTLPPREGDVTVFGQPPGADVGADTWHAHVLDVAPFAFADVTLGPLTLTPGVRLSALLVEVDRTAPRLGDTPPIGDSRLDGAFEPRLAARLRATPRLALTAAAGVYHRPPDPADLSAVFGTPALDEGSARHVAAGESLAVTSTMTLDATAFYEDLSDLPVRSRLPTPKLARALIPDGLGRSYGVQVLVRQRLWKGLFGWVSWTMSRSERQYLGDATWRLFDFDQTHVAALVLSQELGAWTLGARFRYATGYPRTPVDGALYDARADRYEPIFGAQNSTRLPAFAQLDLRVDRAFAIGKSRLDTYVEVQNVTFRKNDEEVVYGYDFAHKGYITGLPTLAIAGVRWQWE